MSGKTCPDSYLFLGMRTTHVVFVCICLQPFAIFCTFWELHIVAPSAAPRHVPRHGFVVLSHGIADACDPRCAFAEYL